MVQGGMKCIKYSLFLVNLLFVIAGIALIIVGAITKNGVHQFGDLIKSSNLTVPAYLFIGVGVIIFIIAFLGCCGAVRENHCMMMTYSVLIGLILILEIGAAVSAYYLEDDVEKVLVEGLEESFKQYGNNTDQAQEIRNTWDIFQHELHCCGAQNYTDWFQVKWANSTPVQIPTACCRVDHQGCADTITALTPSVDAFKILWEPGCVKKGLDSINIGRIGAAGITLAVLELLVIICACFMARSIRYSYETV